MSKTNSTKERIAILLQKAKGQYQVIMTDTPSDFNPEELKKGEQVVNLNAPNPRKLISMVNKGGYGKKAMLVDLCFLHDVGTSAEQLKSVFAALEAYLAAYNAKAKNIRVNFVALAHSVLEPAKRWIALGNTDNDGHKYNQALKSDEKAIGVETVEEGRASIAEFIEENQCENEFDSGDVFMDGTLIGKFESTGMFYNIYNNRLESFEAQVA